ncbi:MAG: NFACT RNA binding domain-containing protein [Treponema sp.]|nr:NFACT RNA binding domain-containing protein [Treponema sp.]
MSLNWKEINLILEELDLQGARLQKAVQNAYDLLSLKIYGRSGAKTLLISLSPAACRLHESFAPMPKHPKPLRFAEFLNSKLINGRIEEALQLGDDRIIRLTLCCGSPDSPENRLRIYIRLWSNAANVIVTDMEGRVLDAMRRLPKKGEVSGGIYSPEKAEDGAAEAGRQKGGREFSVRDFPEELLAGLPPDAGFNRKIDAFYRMEGRAALSLEALREEARRKFEGKIDKAKAVIERLREKEAEFSKAGALKESGDLILSNLDILKPDAVAMAEDFYRQYKKAKSGLAEIKIRIEEEEKALLLQEELLQRLLAETNPVLLHKLLKSGGKEVPAAGRKEAKRPGLSFRRGDWLLMVGRDATENDTLLRKHVRGNDLWLHVRDYPGSYVFIKQRPGKTVPLNILLDAGNLALFYSKGRNKGEADLFYTQVKYLRRAKGGPKGLVIPTQEKNLRIKLDNGRLRDLEESKL